MRNLRCRVRPRLNNFSFTRACFLAKLELLLTKLRFLSKHRRQPPWSQPWHETSASLGGGEMQDSGNCQVRCSGAAGHLLRTDYSLHVWLEIVGAAAAATSLLLRLVSLKLASNLRWLLISPFQVIAFSATLPNAEALAAWLDDAVMFSSDQRPTPLTLRISLGQDPRGLGTAPVSALRMPEEVQALLLTGGQVSVQPSSLASSLLSAAAPISTKAPSAAPSRGGAGGDFWPESAADEKRRFVDTVLSLAAGDDSSTQGASRAKRGGNNVLVFCGAVRECELEAANIASVRESLQSGHKSFSSSSSSSRSVGSECIRRNVPSWPPVGEVKGTAEARRAARRALLKLEHTEESSRGGSGGGKQGGAAASFEGGLVKMVDFGVAYYHAALSEVAAGLCHANTALPFVARRRPLLPCAPLAHRYSVDLACAPHPYPSSFSGGRVPRMRSSRRTAVGPSTCSSPHQASPSVSIFPCAPLCCGARAAGEARLGPPPTSAK